MPVQFFPLEGCKTTALEIQTAMASSVCKLFQHTLTPDPSTPTSAYAAAIATYSGYADQTFTAWFAPIFAPGSGYQIASPLIQFAYDSTAGSVTNVINGLYVLDAGGKNRIAIIFDNPVQMAMDGQGFDVSIVWLFPTGV